MKPQVGLKKTQTVKSLARLTKKKSLILLLSGIKGDFTTHLIKKIFKDYKDNIMNNYMPTKLKIQMKWANS